MKLIGALAAAGALGAGLYFTLRKGGGGELSGSRRRRGGLRGEDEVHELYLYCENDEPLYRQQRQPIEKNLTKKLEKGIYDHEKAKKLWGYFATNCAKKYAKDVGSDFLTDRTGVPWNKMFSMADRRALATKFADHFRTEHNIQHGR